ncbi:cation diffusion facilitator family transporter [Paenibacillus methanolicus]|uniref:Cation diffusion facilitator family transporter n=1 Tax=Paenibacillus methanolicus TaxID=582686 RepID=A0A5S5BRD8_9BACL|nr:cation diffusion facilitator family transporter [Paenibacillus methanolicus]TYP69494.1 cation diffusion facilitator family transporter [Paenibacillus methanolicus]
MESSQAQTQAQTQSTVAIWISLVSNIVLTVMKLVVGLLFGSQVLVADGIHNAGDVCATAAALISMMISKRPPDEDHPYGHGKAEVIGAGIVAVILILAGLFMGYHSVQALMEPAQEASLLVLVAAAISLVWKQWLYLYTMRIGRQTNSSGLIATAYDHLADVYASLAAVLGISMALAGDYYGIRWLMYGDPLAGIVVAYFVIRLAIHMGRTSIDVLMEKNVSSETLEEITQLVLGVPEVKRIDRIRAREHGHYMIVDVRVGIPAQLSVQQGHDVSRAIKKAIASQMEGIEEVLVHLNPWYADEQTEGAPERDRAARRGRE